MKESKTEQKNTLKLLKEQQLIIQTLFCSHLNIGRRNYYDWETSETLKKVLNNYPAIFKSLEDEN
jgi:hypothetical protein